jgi:hypothetical protein
VFHAIANGLAQPGFGAPLAKNGVNPYMPYLMTGERWYLDRLNAQASWAITSMTPDSRYGRCVAPSCDIELTLYGQQVRGMAWSLREIGEAAFVGKRANYFASVMDHNWQYAQKASPSLVTAEGETAIWWPRIWDPNGLMQPWEQDFSDRSRSAPRRTGRCWRKAVCATAAFVAEWALHCTRLQSL